MRKVFFVSMCILLALGVYAQEEKRVFITGFEDTEELTGEWAWTGGAFVSFVDYPTDPKPVEGEAALLVIYDNAGSEWQHSTLNFAIPPVDLTGMRELHMSFYFMPFSTGTLQVRMDLPGGNILGFDTAPTAGEWHELVWKIDRKTAVADFMKSISQIQGFIVPTPGDAAGEVYVDNFYAVLPANTPSEFEEVLLYGFNKADPATGAPEGWTLAGTDGYMPEMAGDLGVPSEGTDSMVMYAWNTYLQNVKTTNALEVFDRWAEVLEIQLDAKLTASIPGSWMQSRLTLRSGIGEDADTVVTQDTKEIGYADATSAWKTLLWEVDMSEHLANIQAADGWFEVRITTNQDASADGSPILIDNFRVTVPKTPVSVSDWSLF